MSDSTITTIAQELLEVLIAATSASASLSEKLDGIAAAAEWHRLRKALKRRCPQVNRELTLRVKLVEHDHDLLAPGDDNPEDATSTPPPASTPDQCLIPGRAGCAPSAKSARRTATSLHYARLHHGRKVCFSDWLRLVDDDALSRGTRVPQSALFRDFCRNCGTPMRQCWVDLLKTHNCERCSPKRLHDHNSPAIPSAPLPSWDNAVRALEDGR